MSACSSLRVERPRGLEPDLTGQKGQSQRRSQASGSPTPINVGELRTNERQKSPEAPQNLSEKTKATKTKPSGTVDSSPILGRPKAFYITEAQDRDLDTLVAGISQRLAGRLNFKVDRSVVARLILESSILTSQETTDLLADELVTRLVSQLTG
jgi:hypothetical protein